MAIRAKDIAEMMNVSTSAVSIVLNHKPGVSDKTRQEILDKIHELGCDYLIKPIVREGAAPSAAAEDADGTGEGAGAGTASRSIGAGFEAAGIGSSAESGVYDAVRSSVRQTFTGVSESAGAYNTAAEPFTAAENVGFIVYKRVRKIVEESPFFNYFINGIESGLRLKGRHMSYGTLSAELPLEEQAAYLKSLNCAGYIVCGTEMYYEDLEVFKNSGRPFVILDNLFAENDVDAVAINNEQGVRLAIRHLYETGHREIGYIRSAQRIRSFDERFEIAESMLQRLGIPLKSEHILDAEYSENGIRQAVRGFVGARQDGHLLPTAFFAENDYLGCHAAQMFQELGIKVPEDVSVVGFDDRPICQMMQPGLTTVHVPSEILAPGAVNLLMEKLEGGRVCSTKILVGTRLIERESVRRLA